MRFISVGKYENLLETHTHLSMRETHTKAKAHQSHHFSSAVLNSAYYGGKNTQKEKSHFLGLPCVPAHNPL